jgi:glycosidase
MYLVQDVVVNHTGNFFSIDAKSKGSLAQRYAKNEQSLPVTAPTQSPFSLNDVRRSEDARANIYHWTPDVLNFKDRRQELNNQLSGLDDLNTENPLVRDTLRESYGYWIREVGVDAFRVDTAFYVPPDYFRDFLYSPDVHYPGMKAVAKATGRHHFHVFGEGLGIDKPFEESATRKIARYMRDAQGRALMPGMVNFPLYGALGDVFARGHPTAELSHRIRSMMSRYPQPHLMVNFVDNHDVDRFLAGGSRVGLEQALLALMTLPGIPAIYYGTEQGFKQQRAAMFKAGYQSGGKDHFDTNSPLYQYLKRVTALRKAHPTLSRGTPRILSDNAAQPGVIAYEMSDGKERLIIAMNTLDVPVLLYTKENTLENHTLLKGVFDKDGGEGDELVVNAQGRMSAKLEAKAARVWRVTAEKKILNRPQAVLSLGMPLMSKAQGDFTVKGLSSNVSTLKLVVDDDLGHAQSIQGISPDAKGAWTASVRTAAMLDPKLLHRLLAYDEASGAVSNEVSFTVSRDWQLMADVRDPAGDDKGPTGTYRYPTDATYGAHRQMDIRRVKVFGAGSAMKIALTMKEVTSGWSPANGFDHVAFTVFIEMPDMEGGVTVMPLQRAQLPVGMKWHYRLRAHGWSNALFSSLGASDTVEGTLASRAARIEVDAKTSTINFILPGDALGNPKTLKGARLYVTTWDYDGGYRELAPEPAAYVMGSGGAPASGPYIMDDTAVITLH